MPKKRTTSKYRTLHGYSRNSDWRGECDRTLSAIEWRIRWNLFTFTTSSCTHIPRLILQTLRQVNSIVGLQDLYRAPTLHIYTCRGELAVWSNIYIIIHCSVSTTLARDFLWNNDRTLKTHHGKYYRPLEMQQNRNNCLIDKNFNVI